MQTVNHPKLSCVADLARLAPESCDVVIENDSPIATIADPLDYESWPSPPDTKIPKRTKAPDPLFKLSEFSGPEMVTSTYTFPEYIDLAYRAFDAISLDEREWKHNNPKLAAVTRRLKPFVKRLRRSHSDRRPQAKGNPYRGLPTAQYWKAAVSEIPMGSLCPISEPSFRLRREERIGTAGSCFAQHIAK